jgi:hypothetical protein
MREYFAWEHGLSDDVAARALLLAGLLPPSMARRETLPGAPELAKLLVTRWQRLHGRPWAWRLRESTARLIHGLDNTRRLVESADELLALTRNDWSREGRGLRLEVNIPDQLDPGFLYSSLLRGGAQSAFLRRKDEGEMAWSWPLLIGVASTSKLLAGVGPNSSLRFLFQEFHFERAPMRANLLLFDASLSEVTNTHVRSQRRSSTDAVIIFGGVGETDKSLWPMLSLVSEATGAQGLFIFDELDEVRAQAATRELIVYLSHDLPLDSACARLAAEHGVSVLAWATRSLVEATSVREQGRILARRLKQMRSTRFRLDRETFGPGLEPPSPQFGVFEQLPGLPVFSRKRRSASATWVRAKDLGATLEERLRSPEEAAAEGHTEKARPEPISFDRESHGARTLAMLAKAVAAESDADAARHEARYLQARVETRDGRAIRGEARLLPSSKYVAFVFIGARDSAWLGLDEPLKTPEPPEGSPLILDVLFWEPQASPEPQVAQLKLQPRGDTRVVAFPFSTAEDQSIFSARIAVYHRNRNLQTGLLHGLVGKEPAKLQFTPDAAPLPKFVGLTDRTGVDVSIIVNDDPSGNMQAFVYRDHAASVGRVSDEPNLSVNVDPSQAGALAKLTDALGRAITRITTNPDDFNDLSKEGSRTLLLELAQHGSALLTRLRKHSQMRDQFDGVEYIQIVMAHVDAFFPIEYLYDGDVPEDNANMCGDPLAQAAPGALASGICCGAYDANPRQTICPLRFWSLTKVIERHAHLPEHTSLGSQFQLRSTAVSARNRLLDPLRCAVLAASTNADAGDKDTVTNLRAKLDAVLRTKPVPLANDWASWAKDIARTSPNLLILLPHHEQAGGFDLLEIGGDKRKSMQIRPEHVRSPQDPDARPIVLLIGCQTNAAKIDLEGFVPAFQDAGAVIIVSTIATILGRHAGPAAAAIVEELKKHEGNVNATFGEVMRAVRRGLLAKGTPMALGLTSYGDADWRIGAPDGDN